MSKKTENTRKSYASRAVIITGIPSDDNADDVINTLVSKFGLKKPLIVFAIGEDGRGKPRHVVLLHQRLGRDKLLHSQDCKHNGKTYHLFGQACTEEDFPEEWLKWLNSMKKAIPPSAKRPGSTTSATSNISPSPSRQSTQSRNSDVYSCEGKHSRPESTYARPQKEQPGTNDECPRVIEVRGFPSNTTEDGITFYFENKRRSRGGSVEKLEMCKEENVAFVYFEDYEAAARVLAQESHFINKVQVKVTAHINR